MQYGTEPCLLHYIHLQSNSLELDLEQAGEHPPYGIAKELCVCFSYVQVVGVLVQKS